MARFDRQIATAKKLISKNGQPVTWRSFAAGANPSQPWKPTAGTSNDTTVEMCFLPATKQTLEFMGLSEVPVGTVVGLMGLVPFEPSLSDVVIREGKELRIEKIDLLSPNGQKILYTVLFKL